MAVVVVELSAGLTTSISVPKLAAKLASPL
jgi:hypothetical protein